MGTLENNRVTIRRFFDGQPVTYNSKAGDITTILTLQERRAFRHASGVDYDFWADLEINRGAVSVPPAGRYLEFKWAPQYFHISSDKPMDFGGLFTKLQEPVEAIASMLSADI